MAKLDGSWNYSPGSGPSYNMAQHPMMAQPVAMSPGTAGPNSVAPVSANQVAEQLENSLHISCENQMCTPSLSYYKATILLWTV